MENSRCLRGDRGKLTTYHIATSAATNALICNPMQKICDPLQLKIKYQIFLRVISIEPIPSGDRGKITTYHIATSAATNALICNPMQKICDPLKLKIKYQIFLRVISIEPAPSGDRGKLTTYHIATSACN
jgi:hypothetical protein